MRSRALEPCIAIDGVDGQTGPVGLVTNRAFRRSVDVTLLSMTANMDAALIWPVLD